MQLHVVTPAGSKVEATITQVTAPGELGDMGILPGHLPLLSGLGIGILSYTPQQGNTHYLAVNGGYVEVDSDDVIVVTETAERPEEIDVERARAALERSERESATVDTSAPSEIARVGAAIRRAANRLEVAKLSKSGGAG